MAVSAEIKNKYKTTVGIECHVQLKTTTKLFSAVSNNARDAKPNTLISHIDAGLPGALPVLNRAALELAARAAFALNTEPQRHSYFERKHYFYPDSPLGYQISQLHAPIIVGGSVIIKAGGQEKTIRINRAQLEADAGKNTHPEGADYSLVDLNRAGTPLLEIVSEPDINSAAEAKAYARELYLIMKFADVSDVDLYHGNMRFDVNVSVSRTDQLGKRSEVKNLNSFRSVENAINFEIERQIELLEAGRPVDQETRGWDEAKQKTTAQRGKEEAQDYRYMPEPDIPPIELDDKFVNNIKANLPKLPRDIREILNKLSISDEVVEDILDWPIALPAIFELYENKGPKHARLAVFWILHSQLADSALAGLDWKRLGRLADMITNGELNSNAAQEVFNEMALSSKDPAQIAEQKNLLQVSDESELDRVVAEVISQNPQAAADVKSGEVKAIGFLVGQVMAKSQGKANPQVAQRLINQQLGR